jgi:hypothetical protein
MEWGLHTLSQTPAQLKRLVLARLMAAIDRANRPGGFAHPTLCVTFAAWMCGAKIHGQSLLTKQILDVA